MADKVANREEEGSDGSGKSLSSTLLKYAPVLAITRVVTVYIEKFGWVGTTTIFAVIALHYWSTEDQKRRMIEMYVLGENIGRIYPIAVLGGLFLVLLYLQHRMYKKKLSLMESQLATVKSDKKKLSAELRLLRKAKRPGR